MLNKNGFKRTTRKTNSRKNRYCLWQYWVQALTSNSWHLYPCTATAAAQIPAAAGGAMTALPVKPEGRPRLEPNAGYGWSVSTKRIKAKKLNAAEVSEPWRAIGLVIGFLKKDLIWEYFFTEAFFAREECIYRERKWQYWTDENGKTAWYFNRFLG